MEWGFSGSYAVEAVFRGTAYVQVPSRFMRKFICRLRLNEVSRQWRLREYESQSNILPYSLSRL